MRDHYFGKKINRDFDKNPVKAKVAKKVELAHKKLIHSNCGGILVSTKDSKDPSDPVYCVCSRCNTSWNVNYLDEMIDIELESSL